MATYGRSIGDICVCKDGTLDPVFEEDRRYEGLAASGSGPLKVGVLSYVACSVCGLVYHAKDRGKSEMQLYGLAVDRILTGLKKFAERGRADSD